ncbi:hypothetical protein KIL84_009332 [Mauremys mutica]|uniref:Uncharacterized protein n=1 Tax=Mauremys mutica TaxID=74926 RepID=A0A9D4B4S4_9SAUR|nr:hypothetical protein KIL84_009332 [Mauremys mutica]
MNGAEISAIPSMILFSLQSDVNYRSVNKYIQVANGNPHAPNTANHRTRARLPWQSPQEPPNSPPPFTPAWASVPSEEQGSLRTSQHLRQPGPELMPSEVNKSFQSRPLEGCCWVTRLSSPSLKAEHALAQEA